MTETLNIVPSKMMTEMSVVYYHLRPSRLILETNLTVNEWGVLFKIRAKLCMK